MAITGHTANPDYRYSINTFPGNGSQINWEISFAGGYLSRDHIKAFVTDASGNATDAPLGWTGDFQITVIPPVPTGSTLTVYRDTPRDKPLADFSNGAVISEGNLDRNAAQAVFIAAESLDRGEGALSELSPRAILVPIGETAPGFPPRTTVLGKALGVNLAGEIVGIGLGPNGADPSTDMILHEGVPLDQLLRNTIASIEASAEDIHQTADDIVELGAVVTQLGEDAIAAATNTQAIEDRLDAVALDHGTLTGVVDAIIGLGDVDEGLATLIVNETAARTTADSALAAKVALLGAAGDGDTSFILDLDTVKVGPTETLADRFTALSTTTGDASAMVTAEQAARIAADTAEATARTTLGTTLRGETAALGTALRAETAAAILTEQNTRSSAISAEASARTTLASTLRGETASAISGEVSARNTAISAAIVAEASTRASADAAEATNRTTLASTLRGETAAAVAGEASARTTAISAAIASEASTRATAISAEASARTSLAATLRGETAAAVAGEASSRATAISAAITSERTARSNAISAETTARNLQASALTADYTAQIAAEASTRASADSQFTQNFSLLGARNPGGTAFVLDMNKVETSPGVSMASRLGGIDTAVGNNAANITTLDSAISTGLGAEAYQRGLLATTVGSHTSSISSFSGSIGGLQTRYGVRLNGNGHITGFEMNNNSTSGDAVFTVDTFKVSSPGSTAVFGVFTISGGLVYFSANVRIDGNLFVTGTITANKFLTDQGVDLSSLVPGTISWRAAYLDPTDLGPTRYIDTGIVALSGTGYATAATTVTITDIEQSGLSSPDVWIDANSDGFPDYAEIWTSQFEVYYRINGGSWVDTGIRQTVSHGGSWFQNSAPQIGGSKFSPATTGLLQIGVRWVGSHQNVSGYGTIYNRVMRFEIVNWK